MADVTLNIHANYQDAIQGTKELTSSMDKLDQETKQYNQTVQSSMKSAVNATQQMNREVQREKGLIEDLDDTIKDWEQRLRKATNVKDIEKYNRKIAEGRIEMEAYKKKGVPAIKSVNKEATSGIAIFKKLGGVIAAGFSIGVITNFVKASMAAYDIQAKAERKLLVALKGREGIQKALLKQASDLQKVTLFGDEQTIEAQAQLAKLLGNNYDAIFKLTPLVQDLATIYDMDLATAADLVGKSVGSSTNALSRYGIQINGSVGSAERLTTAVNELNRVVGGQAQEAALVGTAAFKKLSNEWGDAQEVIGEGFTTFFEGLLFQIRTNPFISWLGESIASLKEESRGLADLGFEEAKKMYESRRAALKIDQEKLLTEQNVFTKTVLQSSILEHQKYISELEKLYGFDKKTTVIGETTEEMLDRLRKKEDANLKQLIEETNKKKQIQESANKIERETQIDLGDDLEKIAEDNIKSLIDLRLTEFEEFKKINDELIKSQAKLIKFTEDHPFWASLGIENNEQLAALKQVGGEISNLISSIADNWVQNTELIVRTLDTRIAEQQRALDQEIALAEEGFASNVTLKRQELEQLQQERDKALAEQQKALKAQQAIEAVSQGIALASSVANIIKVFSEIPFVGLALAAGAIATMFSMWANAKNQIADTTKFEKGGLLKGKSHAEGGIRVGNVEMEGDEYVINKKSTKKFLPLIEAINEDNLKIDHNLIKDLELKQATFEIKETPEIREIRDMMKKIMSRTEVSYEGGYRIERFGNVRRRIG